MAEHVCPWWMGPLLASPLRRMMDNPNRILAPHVSKGMTILEPGPGMGFFTLELARLVGPHGKVVAVDIQPQMLSGLERRAKRAGLAERIECRLGKGAQLGISDLAASVDFVLAYAVVHELPDAGAFFREAAYALKKNGRILFAEPSGPVDEDLFAAELRAAGEAGLFPDGNPSVSRSRTAILTKKSI
jgi:ubiquinone/menaquinone biosynthesis C-methylase UbiE